MICYFFQLKQHTENPDTAIRLSGIQFPTMKFFGRANSSSLFDVTILSGREFGFEGFVSLLSYLNPEDRLLSAVRYLLPYMFAPNFNI